MPSLFLLCLLFSVAEAAKHGNHRLLGQFLELLNARHAHSADETGIKVIGIVTLPGDTELLDGLHQHNYKVSLDSLYKLSYFPLSYAEWVSRPYTFVVPIDIQLPGKQLRGLLDNIGGLLLTGGRVPLIKHAEPMAEEEEDIDEALSKESEKTRFAKKVIWLLGQIERKYRKQQKRIPVWGTCLGFEGLMLKEAEGSFDFDRVENQNVASSIQFVDGKFPLA